MSNDTLTKPVVLTIALMSAIAWSGGDRHVGCKVPSPV
jgi:hypothetical protein